MIGYKTIYPAFFLYSKPNRAFHFRFPYLLSINAIKVSTIFLALMYAEFLTPTTQLIIQGLFAVSFFICRILLSPYIYYEIITIIYSNIGDCFPRYLFYITMLSALFFHSLNVFWFLKIIKKIKRELVSKEVEAQIDSSSDDWFSDLSYRRMTKL